MDIEQTLSWYEHRKVEIQAEYEANSGQLVRHEFWRLEYYNNPYLLLCSYEEIHQRFIDIFANVCGLTKEGKIAPYPDEMDGDNAMFRAFTQILEACNSRGGLQPDMIEKGRKEILKYFADGEPKGVRMFGDLPTKQSNTIVRYSSKKYLETMLDQGVIRLSPASAYSKGSLLKSMKDLETEKTFRIPAVNEALAGKTHIEMQGHKIPIEGGAVTMPIRVADYYLFSTCLELDRRMPTDFNADAALVIEDTKRFTRAVKKAIKRQIGQCYVFSGPVSYFDPFRWNKKKPIPEMMKHFAYKYQKEHRIAARPVNGLNSSEPVYIEIGSMKNYARLVY